MAKCQIQFVLTLWNRKTFFLFSLVQLFKCLEGKFLDAMMLARLFVCQWFKDGGASKKYIFHSSKLEKCMLKGFKHLSWQNFQGQMHRSYICHMQHESSSGGFHFSNKNAIKWDLDMCKFYLEIEKLSIF